MHTTFRHALALGALALTSLSAQAAPTLVYSSATSDYYLSERAGTWTEVEAAAAARRY